MRFTKKISKIPQKGSCGHFIKHMAGSIFVLCYMLLSSGFWPKPCFISDDHLSPTSPASLLVPPWSIKVERWAERHHAVPMPATHATHLSGSPLSLSPCLRASLDHKDTASTSPEQRRARHWPPDARPVPRHGVPAHAVSAPRPHPGRDRATLVQSPSSFPSSPLTRAHSSTYQDLARHARLAAHAPSPSP
jgi:hypothetical protein